MVVTLRDMLDDKHPTTGEDFRQKLSASAKALRWVGTWLAPGTRKTGRTARISKGIPGGGITEVTPPAQGLGPCRTRQGR